jgi:hypothetical protein
VTKVPTVVSADDPPAELPASVGSYPSVTVTKEYFWALSEASFA